MKRILAFSLLCLTLMLVGGCGVSSDMTFNQNEMQTNVVLSQNNFVAVKTVTGEASSTYFLVFGGLRRAETKAAAMSDMVWNAELSGSQAIVNASVSMHVQTILGIYTKVTAYATGTVVEFF